MQHINANQYCITFISPTPQQCTYMAYVQSNTDPVSVNGMYLKLYTDLIRDISEDLKDGGNVQSFKLHSMLLRSTVIRKHLQDDIDIAISDMNEKIKTGLYGDVSVSDADYYRGFCIVGAAMTFIGDAFHIIQNDSASLADVTDDELMVAVERHMMSRKTRQILGNDRERIKLLEKRISEGDIPDMANLIQELTAPDEMIPQDDSITQETATGVENDQQY